MQAENIIITGASGLIGSALSSHLEELGHSVVRVDCDIPSSSVGMGSRIYDMASHDSVKRMCAVYAKRCWALINCFAMNDHVRPGEVRGTILDLDPSHFGEMMNVNVTALFTVCQEFAKARIGMGGNIINFGASTGIVTARTDMYGGLHKNIGYSTSKAAVIHMTKILGTHLQALDKDFRVNCISPGGIESDQDESFKKLYGLHTPAGRMGRVEDLFPAIDMLLDRKNTYMVGENIVVDGGWTIQ